MALIARKVRKSVPRPANEDRRPEILEATCRMIAREGVHNFTMGQVAKEAGISRALISYYFQTRGELLRDALAFAEQRAIAEIASRASASGTAVERLTDTLALEFDGSPAVRENWLLWESLTEAAMFEQDLRGPIDPWSLTWNQAIAEMIRDGQRAKEIPGALDPNATAERLTGLVDGLGPRWLLGEITAERAQRLLRAAIDAELGAGRSRS